MLELKDVANFGAIDADNDALLLDCFEDHEAFLSVMNRTRFLVVGRKGSGKTAIFKKMLAQRASHYFCLGHTFSDYPWHHHDLQARVGIPDFDKFTHSWKYLILLSISKIVLNFDQSLPIDDQAMESMAKVEKFVVDTYGTRDPDVTQLFTPSKSLRLKPYFELDWKILKAGIAPESVPMKELPTIVQELNQNLSHYVIGCLNPEHDYFICFDQLDLGFDPTGDYRNRLIGLLLAARDLNVAARERGKKLFIAIFLRDDIYETLHFEDENKLTENFLSLIEWDTPRTDKTLKTLMEKRFKAVLGNDPKWNEVFDETKEMPGHQTKYQHILDRTYLRPRDIIKFVNSVLNRYKIRKVQANGVPSHFENIDLNDARIEYSTYLMNELDDKIHKHLPHYEDLVELLRNIGVWQFGPQEFEAKYGEMAPTLSKPAGPKAALQELYDFSLIGFYRPGGRGYGGSEYVFKYKEPRTRLDLAASRFRIHPGLIEVLGLKKFTVSAGEGAGEAIETE